LFLVLASLAACGAPPPVPGDPRSQGTIQWEPIDRWSGRGDQRLDSFNSSGVLRIEWEAKPVPGAPTPGSLRIIPHSAISGRPLGAAVVDHRGEGKGVAYLSEEARTFFIDVMSSGLDWTIVVSERVR
jgi:hypothetical protein